MENLLQLIKHRTEATTGYSLDVKARERSRVVARCIYCSLAREFTFATTTQIGKEIGRDHTTVLHSLNNIENHLKYEPALRDIYESLTDEIREIVSGRDYVSKRKILKIIDRFPKEKYPKILKVLEKI